MTDPVERVSNALTVELTGHVLITIRQHEAAHVLHRTLTILSLLMWPWSTPHMLISIMIKLCNCANACLPGVASPALLPAEPIVTAAAVAAAAAPELKQALLLQHVGAHLQGQPSLAAVRMPACLEGRVLPPGKLPT